MSGFLENSGLTDEIYSTNPFEGSKRGYLFPATVFSPSIGRLRPQKIGKTGKLRLIVDHHCNQSKYAITEESDEPNLIYQPKTHFWANWVRP